MNPAIVDKRRAAILEAIGSETIPATLIASRCGLSRAIVSKEIEGMRTMVVESYGRNPKNPARTLMMYSARSE